MTLRHFQIFNTVCQEGSLTAAAQRLGISQPAVSIAIKELEAFYGTRLFERMNRRIYISPSGEALLQYVGTVLSQFDESVRVIRDEDYATECRFGVNVTVGETRLGDFMAGARAAQPAIQARVVVENSAAIEEMLLHNRIDFAVIDEPSALPGCASEPIYREAMAVVCAPEAMAAVGAPKNPAAVSTPEDPAAVGAPKATAVTGVSEAPAAVGAPGTPAAVGSPETPAVVGAPGAPVAVGAPGTMAAVGAPGTPAVVSAPEAPVAVDALGTPAAIGTPGAMAAVGTPGTPAVVGAPGVPAAFGAPGTPAAASAPGTPATVGATGTSSGGGTPGTPAAVGAPGAPAEAITLEVLATKPLLLRETGSGSRTTVDRVFAQRGLVVRPVLESVSTLALIHMARAGLGYAILPEAVVREEIKKGGLAAVALADGAFDRTYYLIVHQNKFLTRAAREMMAVIRGCAAGSGRP